MADGFPLRYAHAETLVAALLDVHSDRRSALTARFKLLRRLSFPPGVNTGKSNADYTFDTIMMTLVGFSLLDALVQPKAMTTLLPASWPQIRHEVVGIIKQLKLGERGTVDISAAERRFLVLQPRAHRHWSSAEDLSDEEGEDLAPATVKLMGAADLSDIITAPHSPFPAPSLIAIDLSGLIRWIAQSLHRADFVSLDQLQAAAAERPGH